jgi:aldehyde:ferredoxin oxidoreductase
MTKRSLEDRINHLHKLMDGYRQENKKVKAKNKFLKVRNQRLETFVEKARCGFKIWYYYHHDGGNSEYAESITDRFIVAQNIETIEDANKMLEMFESNNNDSHVSYVITSPAEVNDDDLPF